jgi:cytochrome c5
MYRTMSTSFGTIAGGVKQCSLSRNVEVLCLLVTLRRMFVRTAIWLVLTVTFGTLSMVAAQELPAGEGKKLVEERCASCHSLKPVVNLKQSQSEWKKLVIRMVGYGAQLDGKEVDVATEYLAKYFAPPSSVAAVKPDSPEEKIAKRYIEGICSSCHDAGLIRSTEATKQEWFDIVTRMNGLDAGVSQRDVDLLVDYLASKYGRK